jgi:isopenicillin N synthase-like dioxygenase
LGRSIEQTDFTATARAVDLAEIPVIDFAPFLEGGVEGRRTVAQAIAEASRRIGFFYLSGHGVPEAVREAAFQASAAFYALPAEEREKVRATPDWYRGLMSLSQDIGAGKRYFEQYRIQDEFAPDPEADPQGRFFRPNRWPESQPRMARAAMAYFRAMTDLSRHLLKAFALGLGLPEDRFDEGFKKPLSQLSLLYYSALPEGAQVEVQNAAAHTDEGPFTILAQGQVGGLEVRRRDGAWIAAPPIPGTFVINIGNMMMWWSNGRYLSNMHRVRNTSGQERFSIPFFFNPDQKTVVGPLPELVAADGEARFPSVEAGVHLTRFYATLERAAAEAKAPAPAAQG